MMGLKLEIWKDLKELINKSCIENVSNTPDYILATYLSRCLEAFEDATRCRDNWYGLELHPGCDANEGLSEVKK
ncbi:hypothetical protein LCGC14_2397950 [marine sediment metagenome]|uniref:Uncharacterized protein n=1 Tax=marine sediment metagenome TaxID=412755 RepID=A0A0F9E8J4_9ZZZZ